MPYTARPLGSTVSIITSVKFAEQNCRVQVYHLDHYFSLSTMTRNLLCLKTQFVLRSKHLPSCL